MNFIAIDVETANADLASICQVGIATFRDGLLHRRWSSLVDPEDEFDVLNVSIHGIDEQAVQHAPTWKELCVGISCRINGHVVVSHTPFDRSALLKAFNRAKFPMPECRWLDSARVVRRSWQQFSRSGYGLSNVAAAFSISYKAHDAFEDARCAGLIVLKAIEETGLGVEEWLHRVEQPIDLKSGKTLRRAGNPDGCLFGEVVVFTGKLSGYSKPQAADIAAGAGCDVTDNVTKHTTLLVVGDQDVRRLAGKEKSRKHLMAEEFIRKGKPLRILTETDFLEIAKT